MKKHIAQPKIIKKKLTITSMKKTQFCTNVDHIDFANGRFPVDAKEKTTIIMILDKGLQFKLPLKQPVGDLSPAEVAVIHPGERTEPIEWSKVYAFNFADTDITQVDSITDAQVAYLAEAVIGAYHRGDDLIVHCYVGVSRSGAVVEFAQSLGFTPVENVYRAPNEKILSKLTEYLKNRLP